MISIVRSGWPYEATGNKQKSEKNMSDNIFPNKTVIQNVSSVWISSLILRYVATQHLGVSPENLVTVTYNKNPTISSSQVLHATETNFLWHFNLEKKLRKTNN